MDVVSFKILNLVEYSRIKYSRINERINKIYNLQLWLDYEDRPQEYHELPYLQDPHQHLLPNEIRRNRKRFKQTRFYFNDSDEIMRLNIPWCRYLLQH